jgi:hypothetical protein
MLEMALIAYGILFLFLLMITIPSVLYIKYRKKIYLIILVISIIICFFGTITIVGFLTE